MKIWKNTSTLDGYDEGLLFTNDKAKAEIAIIGSKSICLNDFPSLKGIFRAGIGKDNVPEEQAAKREILVRYPDNKTINIIFSETAAFTCSLIFRMLYNSVGQLEKWSKFDRVALSSKTLLVIGKGNIGSRVAKNMKPFMKVITFDIIENKLSSLPSLLSQADCTTIHIPKTENNKNFLDKKKLAIMKDGSVIINTARGSLVNEEALYEELSSKRLKAAFDVFWEEPYNGKLKKFHPDYFFMTPHLASTCNGFLNGCRRGLDDLMIELRND